MLAAVTAVWTATFSAHALVIRSGSPLLAVLPLAALVGFADTVLKDGARPFYAVSFLLAALIVVFLDGLRRIRQWGPVWVWHGLNRRLAVSTARGAERVAVLAIAVAALVPGILPGFRSQALVDFSASGSKGVNLDPFVSIKAQLDLKEPVDLFRVRSVDRATGQPVPTYWRLYALDQFNGTSSTNTDLEGTRRQILSTAANLSIPMPGATAPMIEQQYHMLIDLDYPWLPMAYPPETVRYGAVRSRYTPTSQPSWRPRAGRRVPVHGLVTIRRPDPGELNRVTLKQMVSAPWYREDTSLPDDVPRVVHDLALALTRDAKSPYQKVYAIQRYFTASNRFAYATDAGTRSDTNALVDFLTVSKRGFCQQFATAMTVLVRKSGSRPASRSASGRGIQNGDTFTVSSRDAHSWVEVCSHVRMADVRADAVPSQPPRVRAWLLPQPRHRRHLPGQREEVRDPREEGESKRPAAFHDRASPHPRESARWRGGQVPEIGPIDTGYYVPYGLLLLAFLVLTAAFLVLTPMVKALWRRRMLRRAREPRELVLAAYRVFDGGAAELGLSRADGETLTEHRDRLTRVVRFSDGHLLRLTAAATDAAYSDHPVPEDEAREAVRAARVALRDMRKEAGFFRRLAGTYRLRA